MSRLIVVKVAVPVDAPLGSALTKLPTRMRAGFLRVMAEIGHQNQSGMQTPALEPAARAGTERDVRDPASLPPDQPDAIELRRAW